MKYEPDHTLKLHGGTQKIYKFKNGYGASVIKHSHSYGSKRGLWELAVLSNDTDNLIYSTPITDNVIGYLSDDDVEAKLKLIDELPPKTDSLNTEQ